MPAQCCILNCLFLCNWAIWNANMANCYMPAQCCILNCHKNNTQRKPFSMVQACLFHYEGSIFMLILCIQAIRNANKVNLD